MSFSGNYQQAIDWFRLNKRNMQAAFAPGAPCHDALVLLAKRCRAFEGDVVIGNHDLTVFNAGQRAAFWFIVDYLRLQPEEIFKLRDTVQSRGEAA